MTSCSASAHHMESFIAALGATVIMVVIGADNANESRKLQTVSDKGLS